jgi:sugar-specific transcriptional regulator TrmB
MTLAQERPISSTELENFGLSNYEAKTYLNMLSMGLCTAKEISDESEVPFGRIYDVLGSLEDKGLIERQDSRPKKFIANEPKTVMKNLLTIKNHELDQLTRNATVIEEKLTSLYTSEPSESVFWSVALEDESIHRHNQKILEAESEILIYLNMVYSIHILNPEEIKEFLQSINEVMKRGVRIKLLIGGINEQNFLENNKDFVYEFVPLLKSVEIRFTSNVTNTFDIIDKEKVILKIPNPISSNEYFALIYLWQKTFAEKMRQKYFDLWERGEKLAFDFSLKSN